MCREPDKYSFSLPALNRIRGGSVVDVPSLIHIEYISGVVNIEYGQFRCGCPKPDKYSFSLLALNRIWGGSVVDVPSPIHIEYISGVVQFWMSRSQ